ncbi:cache domain-containing protein [Rosenbergiella australiborealis]|uniref:cache domain-containing protein n=1 Tax=Rosenbergiella australiborealis TaxID=1544696 RepID=UPI001F4DC2EF|nr:cache domain-containing protein [Rosenbergiella australiborealis]
MNPSIPLQAVIARLDQLFMHCSASSQHLADMMTHLMTPLLSTSVPSDIAVKSFPKQEIESFIHQTLAANDYCSGAGFAYHAESQLNPHHDWSLFWIYKDNREGSALELNQLTHQHLDFRTFEWFLKTKSSKRNYFHGPYVDYICNTSYTMTSASPIVIQDCFYGVAAVDILVSRIEQEVLKALMSSPIKIVLTNNIQRIIFSNHSGFRVGDILRGDRLLLGHQHSLFSIYLPG